MTVTRWHKSWIKPTIWVSGPWNLKVEGEEIVFKSAEWEKVVPKQASEK